MGLMSYNGGGIIAMTGKNCVAIASDLRLGSQSTTLAVDFQKTFKIHDTLIVGLAGLVTDMQTLSQRFKFRHNLYRLREDRDMRVSAFANMVSSMLYEKRFGPYYCEPIIAGLEPDGTPFVMGMDLIGAQGQSEDFVVAGSNTESLFGVCESFYRNDMSPEELFETVAQCLLSGVDRDCLAGWGGIVHIITPEGTVSRTLKGRMD
mmetsp:Transcript_40107/g.55732  ORF Transcript_40107/g.55732 Transcript_40107/m.55732 type:complete len:205 (-) Transcript_40107:185-799(-)|eukprot:CAMPEP_0196581272 /NCGR_PEP_ID=MMETSP1081-20130531/33325_1 /TAXON_ID=36882 /ORGANISM="Pyramimonas amylifera, Strain CCMP720" /LENGTH=204 /DNA_ID=CAMNT_0041901445 /DNA_START=156 /DNA_END=770 /DNA_ORIENTATION=-